MQADAGYCSASSPQKGSETDCTPNKDGLPLWRRVIHNRLFSSLTREPLFLFLIAGGGIFFAYNSVQEKRSDPIVYDRSIEKQLVDDFEAVSGRPATPADKERLRNDYIGDELLFREALSRGMHLSDGEIRERLIDRLRYIYAGSPSEPTEEQLIDYYASHSDLYQTERGISFDQIFFANQPRDAAALLARLNTGEAVKGEDFWLGNTFPNYGDSMIRGMFGQPFLDKLESSPTGRWIGPIRSARGWHFLRKSGSSEPTRIPYASAREQVRQDLMLSTTSSTLDKEIGKLKGKYDVEIAE